MELKELTKEDIVRLVVRYLRSGIHFDFACEYADDIEKGVWLQKDVWETVEHNERLQ